MNIIPFPSTYCKMYLIIGLFPVKGLLQRRTTFLPAVCTASIFVGGSGRSKLIKNKY